MPGNGLPPSSFSLTPDIFSNWLPVFFGSLFELGNQELGQSETRLLLELLVT